MRAKTVSVGESAVFFSTHITMHYHFIYSIYTVHNIKGRAARKTHNGEKRSPKFPPMPGIHPPPPLPSGLGGWGRGLDRPTGKADN